MNKQVYKGLKKTEDQTCLRRYKVKSENYDKNQ